MLKTFALVLGLAACAAGCKTDASDTSAPAASTSEHSTTPNGPKPRSGKIDLPQNISPPRMPADDNSAMNTDQAREERRKQRMAELDTDGDGEISDEEREAARAKREAAMKARLDRDGDGTVSDAERDAARHDRATTMHARFDRDGDGKLTQAELEASPFGRFDATADKNNDGQITVDELDAAMKERVQNGRGGGFRGGRRFRGGGGSAGSGEAPSE